MDAYDIFKKLTKGLTFKKKVLGLKNNRPDIKLLPIKKEEVSEIKAEEIEEVKPEEFSDKSESETDCETESQESNDDLQLIDGVKVGEKRKKKKKVQTEDLQKKLELEEHNRFRNEHGIKTVGRHVPAALQDFSDLVCRYNVSQGLVDTVKECGYEEPTPVQRQALPCMLEDRQIFACAPTGSGKTAAFLLPILHMLGAPQGGPRALVLCPTRELAHQIYREALRLSASTQLRCSVVRNLKESKVKEREATIRKSDIVISTPNRLCYLLNQDNVNISLDKHQTGLEPAPFAIRANTLTNYATAALTDRVKILPAILKLQGSAISSHYRNAATNLVDQELIYCGNENGKLVAFRQLVQKGLRPPVLVFVQSKDRAKQLFKELIYDGINVDVIHADRTQAQRDNVVRSFRVGRIWVLICTELMGRGIDFRGVNLVLNYDFPPSAISYIHRVGRAGRAGQRGKAITFFTQDDVGNLRSIASVMKQSGCEVPEYMLKLKTNQNKRKRLAKKAPNREQISTILQKRPDKRKLDSTKDEKSEQAAKTTIIKNGKNKKHRKLQNGEHRPKQNGERRPKQNGEHAKSETKSKGKNKTLKKKNKNKLAHKKAKT
ncbi:hypothetical protein evm_009610 [Chilo suppressalis]|nr:hypothetical protein evm_009610 [Chilo suppressalis]